MNKLIAISSGDPAGIGPEVIVKALNDSLIKAAKTNFLIIGSHSIFKTQFQTNSNYSTSEINTIHSFKDFQQGAKITILENNSLPVTINKGELTALSGQNSYDNVLTAVDLALKKKVLAIVTAPINKEAWSMAGIKAKGHTELLAQKSKTTNYAMAFYTDDLKITLVTTHLPIKEIATNLTTEKILNKIILSNSFLKQLGFKNPKIGVCGLNPHAGEQGLLGSEEITIINPAIEQVQKLGINALGSFPADTIFYNAYHNHSLDLVVSMYHDQALAPLKLIHFHDAVNVTLGLPFVRTSPDHGTAYDIADKNIANPNSMKNAILLAIKLGSNG